jgi:hypothetical protein
MGFAGMVLLFQVGDGGGFNILGTNYLFWFKKAYITSALYSAIQVKVSFPFSMSKVAWGDKSEIQYDKMCLQDRGISGAAQGRTPSTSSG